MMHGEPVPDQIRQRATVSGTAVRAQQVAPYRPNVGQQAETKAELRCKVASAASLASKAICKTGDRPDRECLAGTEQFEFAVDF